MSVDTSAARPYYEAALWGLRFIEARNPTDRRFGADADARWSSFRGDLTTADRIDLLIRDADAQWPGAFGARTVFNLRAVAEDEAFGAEWHPLDPVDAEELWRKHIAQNAPADIRATLAACAQVWELDLGTFDTGKIDPADRLLVVGPSAIAGTLETFSSSSDFDWTDQVLCVASPPAHRQLAALGGALLNATKPTDLITPDAPAQKKPRRLLISDDANEADTAWARAQKGAA